MNWVKKDTSKTIEEVIERNTGISIADLMDTTKEYTIKNIDKVVAMIRDFIVHKERITIVGDYDADGVDASAIMYMAISSIHRNVHVRIPRRISEGFGLSEKIIDEIPSGLVITVDNGIAALKPVQKAKEKGLTVIVTDHHLPDESRLPAADLIINPNAIPNSADFNGYCGAGIAFKIAEALIPEDKKLLRQLSCFAAIGTIADVMELVHDNRRIVLEGMENMLHYDSRTTGLASILKACELDSHITAKDIAFKVGPMINAPGRLDDNGAMIAFKALTYNGFYKESIGQEILRINENRKEITAKAVEKIKNTIAENCLYGDYPYVIYVPGLPEGIIGLSAGRMAEELQAPCFIFTDSSEKGILKGSARSYGGVHLKDLLDQCSSLLYKYGGHSEAAGVSVRLSNFDALKEALSEHISEPITEESADTLYYDLEIDAKDIPKTLQTLKKYEPFGNGNPQIVFKIKNFALSPRYSSWYKALGEDGSHLKLFGIGVSAIAFGQVQRYVDMKEPHNLSLLGTLSESHFHSFSEPQVECEDFQDTSKPVEKTKLGKALKKIAEERYES